MKIEGLKEPWRLWKNGHGTEIRETGRGARSEEETMLIVSPWVES